MAGELARARFREAIDSFAQKEEILRKDDFLKLQGANRARAFTVARVAQLGVLSDLHDAVGQAIEDGQGYREFIDSLDAIMDAKGWTGLEPWHSRLVFDQNVGMAYTAGRYDQAKDAGVNYWRYLPSDSAVPREDHKRYYGQIFKLGEGPMPPLDFGCNCGWEPVFDEEVAGDDVQDEPPRVSPEQEFQFSPAHYFRPLNLRKSDYPAEFSDALERIIKEQT